MGDCTENAMNALNLHMRTLSTKWVGIFNEPLKNHNFDEASDFLLKKNVDKVREKI